MIKKIIVENPISWMDIAGIGSYVKIFYKNLLDVLKSYNVDLKIIDINFPTSAGPKYDRTPVFDHSDTLYISYHTYGDKVPNLWRIKESYLPGFFTVDAKGFSGFSEFSDTINYETIKQIDYNFANQFLEEIRNKTIKNNISKYPQNKFTNNKNTVKDFIFFPLQMDKDVVINLTKFDFYDLIELVCRNIDFPIVIKIHPYSLDMKPKILKIISKKNNISLTECSIHEIIPNCKCCITINSGVGFESLLHKKPVVTFGKSDYGMATQYCQNKEQIKNDLIHECINNYNSINTTKFLYHYLNNYCFYYNDICNLKLKIQNIILKN